MVGKLTPIRKMLVRMKDLTTDELGKMQLTKNVMRDELDEYMAAEDYMEGKSDFPSIVRTLIEDQVTGLGNGLTNLDGIMKQQNYLLTVLDYALKHWKT